MKIETLLTPTELPALARRDLHATVCVVFDILRATSTFVTALYHGAAAIIPVGEIAEATALCQKQPGFLLAGERDGVRIRAAQKWDKHLACLGDADDVGGTGQASSPSHYSPVDFDFGNSPREYTPERVRGKTIVSTTSNGTRALLACAQAKVVSAASFLNLTATAELLSGENEILLVCAGTGDNPAVEDILAAGALVDLLSPGKDTHSNKSSNSLVARAAYVHAVPAGLENAIASSENGRRLSAITELREDVAFCAQRDVFNLVARMDAGGVLRRV